MDKHVRYSNIYSKKKCMLTSYLVTNQYVGRDSHQLTAILASVTNSFATLAIKENRQLNLNFDLVWYTMIGA